MTTGTTERARAGEADRVLDGDWIEHWRSLVGAQKRTERSRVGPGFWDRRALGFALAASHGPSRPHPVAQFLKPWLDPSKTVIDVGAGTGQLAPYFAHGGE